MAFASTPASSVSGARDIYKEYIEVRKLIGEEANNWETQKVALGDMISVLKTEITQIEEAMSELKKSSTTADQKRAELAAKLEAGRATSTAFDPQLAKYEASVKALSARMPDMLKRELQPLLVRLPDDPSATRLSYSQRMQTLIGIMAQTDKFNSDLKYISEVKTVGTESFEVQTI